MAVVGWGPLGELCHELQERRCGEGDHLRRARSGWPSEREGWCDVPDQRTGEYLLFLRQLADASGNGELHAERPGQQSEQSQRRPATVTQLRSRNQMGLL